MPDKLIKYKQQDLDLDKYVYNLSQNVESWVNTLDWNDSQKEEFWKAYELYKTKLQEVDADNYSILSINDRGSIIGPGLTNVDTDDYYYDQSGNRISGKDYSELAPKKQQRYNNFEANKQVAKYLNVIAKAFSEAKPKEKVKEPVKQSFEKWFLNTQGISSLEDFNYFLELDPIGEGNLRNTNKRVELLVNDILPKYIETLSDEDKQKYLDLKTHLTNNGLDANAKLKMLKLGISSNFFESFFSPYEKLGMTPESYKTWLTQQEQKAEQEERIENERQLLEKELSLDNAWETWLELNNLYANPIEIKIEDFPFGDLSQNAYTYILNPDDIKLFNQLKWNKDVLNKMESTDEYGAFNGDINKWIGYWITLARRNNTIPVHILSKLLYSSSYKDKIVNTSSELDGKSVYRLKNSSDLTNFKTFVWDPIGRKLLYLPLVNTSSGLSEVLDKFNEINNIPRVKKSIPRKLTGGIVIDKFTPQEYVNALQGDSANFYDIWEERNYKERIRQAEIPKKKKEEQTAEPLDWGDLSWEDKTDLSSIALDLASIPALAIPTYGTAVSTGLGISSSTGQFITDISRDGFDFSDAGTFLANVGLDLMQNKYGKISKTLAKLAPKILKIYSLGYVGYTSPYIVAAWEKLLDDPSKLSINDWLHISTSIKAITGGIKFNKNRKAELPTTERGTFEFYDKNGNTKYYTFSGADAIALQGAKTQDDVRNIIKNYLIDPDLELTFVSKPKNLFLPLGAKDFYPMIKPVARINRKLYDYKGNPINAPKKISPNTESRQLDNGEYVFWDANTKTAVIDGKEVNLPSYPPGSEVNFYGNGDLEIIHPDGNILQYINRKGTFLRLWTRDEPLVTTSTDEPVIVRANDEPVLIRVDDEPEPVLIDNESAPVIFRADDKPKVNKKRKVNKKPKVNKKALGGFIHKLQKGRNITNTTNNGVNWFTHMFNTEAMLKYLNTINLNNYTLFNDLQNSWYNNKVASKYQPGQPSVTYLDSVKTRQGLFNATGLNANIQNALELGFIKQAGTSGDNSSGNWQDGYFGELEYLRHAGTVDSWKGKDSELLKTIEMFANKGLNYAPNKNGVYVLSPMSNPQALQETLDWLYKIKNNVSTQSDIPVTSKPVTKLGQTDPAGEDKPEVPVELPKLSYLDRLIPYSMSFSRAGYADGTNRTITDLAKAGEKSFLMDPFTYNRYVQGNLAAINLGDLEAALLSNIKTPYADATLNFAAKLEGFNRGLDRKRYGRMIDDQASRQSYEQVYQQGKENALNEHETGLKNRLSTMLSEANKNKYEQAYLAKKHEIWDTLGKEIEYDFKTLLNDRRNQQEIYNRRAIDSAVRYNLKKYMPSLSDEVIKVWDGVNSGTLQLDYNNTNQMNLYKQAQQAYEAAVYNALGDYARLKTYPIPFTKAGFSPKLQFKQGGAIKERIANAERLFKTIKSDLDRNEKKLTRLYKSLYTLKNKVK